MKISDFMALHCAPDPGQADCIRSANAALGVKGNRPLNNPRPGRYTPGPRISSCLLAAGKPCSLRGLGRWDARARCTASLGRLMLRHACDSMVFHGSAWRRFANRGYGVMAVQRIALLLRTGRSAMARRARVRDTWAIMAVHHARFTNRGYGDHWRCNASVREPDYGIMAVHHARFTNRGYGIMALHGVGSRTETTGIMALHCVGSRTGLRNHGIALRRFANRTTESWRYTMRGSRTGATESWHCNASVREPDYGIMAVNEMMNDEV
jgi:hypothetical protein